jgi:hypothetical protein
VPSRHLLNRTENPRVGGSIPSLATLKRDDNLGDFEPPGAKACRGNYRGRAFELPVFRWKGHQARDERGVHARRDGARTSATDGKNPRSDFRRFSTIAMSVRA